MKIKTISIALFGAFLLAMVLLGCSPKGNSDSTYNGDEQIGALTETVPSKVVLGTTPEETVTIFLNALMEQDAETALACCYIQDYYERVSMEKYVEVVGALSEGHAIAPTEYSFYQELVTYEKYAEFSQKIRWLVYSLLIPFSSNQICQDYMANGLTVADSAWAEEFIQMVDPDQLKLLSIQSIDANTPDLQNSEQVKKRYMNIFGVTNSVERTVVIELNGLLFMKGFTLVEVDGYWQIAQMNAMTCGGDNSMGAATVVESVEEYKEIIR